MKVCVIGTGPSGLTTIKQLLDEGHEVTAFEKNDNIGGIWYRNPDDSQEMKVFDNLVLTISMKLMSYSDFMIEGGRTFYTHRQYLGYLKAYAEKYGLTKCISFKSPVNEIRKSSDGKWHVAVTGNGETTGHEFDAVAVCTGPFQTPNMSVPDLDKFPGEVVHSSTYRNNKRFAGKRVLIVGLAESGADLVREISDVASECTLSIRSYSFLVPRLFSGIYSTDSSSFRALHYEEWVRATDLPYTMKSFFGDNALFRVLFLTCARIYGLTTVVASALSKLFGSRQEGPSAAQNNLQQSMYPLKIDVDTEWSQENLDAINEWNRRSHNHEPNWSQKIIFAKNVTFIPNIVNGKAKVNDSGIERIEGNRVTFKDREFREFDAIVLCTGFVKNFAALGKDISVEDNNVRTLYKHAFHPAHDGRLAFVGFVRPYTGGIPICSEMQARYFALLCSDKLRLPANVRELIDKEKAWEDYWTSLSPRHTEAIPSQIFFIDSIAREIGCLMPISQLVFRPRLLVRQWFYPFNQSCYRLTGPHSMYDTAIKQIMSEKRDFVSNTLLLLNLVLSVLPHSIHPKYIEFPLPGQPRAPRMQPRKAHFLQPRAPDHGIHIEPEPVPMEAVR